MPQPGAGAAGPPAGVPARPPGAGGGQAAPGGGKPAGPKLPNPLDIVLGPAAGLAGGVASFAEDAAGLVGGAASGIDDFLNSIF